MEEEQKACAGGESEIGALCCRAEQIWSNNTSESLRVAEVVVNTFSFSILQQVKFSIPWMSPHEGGG